MTRVRKVSVHRHPEPLARRSQFISGSKSFCHCAWCEFKFLHTQGDSDRQAEALEAYFLLVKELDF